MVMGSLEALECGYIVCRCGDVWCSNYGETFAYFFTFMKKIANMGISNLLSHNVLYQSRPYIQLDRHVGVDV